MVSKSAKSDELSWFPLLKANRWNCFQEPDPKANDSWLMLTEAGIFQIFIPDSLNVSNKIYIFFFAKQHSCAWEPNVGYEII